MIRPRRQAHRDMVVGHVDEDEVRDQPVGGGELAAQLATLGAHALSERTLKLSIAAVIMRG